jgi:hypothetical protein
MPMTFCALDRTVTTDLTECFACGARRGAHLGPERRCPCRHGRPLDECPDCKEGP